MAVAFKMRFEGATLEQYDQVMELMGLASGDTAPEGAIFHWVAKTDDGIIVVDVWERTSSSTVSPRSRSAPSRAGRHPAPPAITRYEVHNTLVGEAAASHPGSFARV